MRDFEKLNSVCDEVVSAYRYPEEIVLQPAVVMKGMNFRLNAINTTVSEHLCTLHSHN